MRRPAQRGGGGAAGGGAVALCGHAGRARALRRRARRRAGALGRPHPPGARGSTSGPLQAVQRPGFHEGKCHDCCRILCNHVQRRVPTVHVPALDTHCKHEPWATTHPVQAEGDLWRALGVLVAGGALRTAVLLLRRLSLPDTAAAFAAACAEAGLRNARAPADAGAPSAALTVLASAKAHTLIRRALRGRLCCCCMLAEMRASLSVCGETCGLLLEI